MTYEEALKICNTAIKYFTLKHYDEQNELVKDLAKRADIVIMADALEKQIPKKPIEQGCLGSKDKYKYGRCPNPLCNNGVNYEMGYCDNCGQRLDWTEDTK